MSNIFLTSHTLSWLSGLMSGISFIIGVAGSADSNIEICYIYKIFMRSGSSNSYINDPNIFVIRNNPNFAKSNLLFGLIIQMKVILVLGIYRKRYTLSPFLRVGPLTLKVSAYFFIYRLKNLISYYNSLWIWLISSIIISASWTNSWNVCFSRVISASNSLLVKKDVFPIMAWTKVW